MGTGYCKYCDRIKPANQIIRKKETYVKNNQKITSYWIGCRDCWERLKKVT